MDRMYCQIVWTTRQRASLIDAGLAAFLCRYLRAVGSQEHVRILQIGMVSTHLHLLVRLRPTTDVSHLLQRFKGGSAAVAGKERHSTDGHVLRWAKGYSIHSISPRDVAPVRAYVHGQPTHHPELAIPGWDGDPGEFEAAGDDEWRSEMRRSGRARPKRRG